jgi:hypothetical protein
MKFISFWYDKVGSSYYKSAHDRLEAQMKLLKYDFSFENLSFTDNSYEHITLHKPTYILEKMYKEKKPVCWIDIDCQFLFPLDLTMFVGDICLGKRDLEGIAPHASVIYANNTQSSIDFLTSWKTRCDVFKNDPTYEGGDHCQLILTYQNYDLSKIDIRQIDSLCSTGNHSYINIGVSPGGVNAENIKSRKFGNT